MTDRRVLSIFSHAPIVAMMTSWNGNISRVTSHFCGEFTGHRWIPRTKASDAELWCILWSASEQTIEQTTTMLTTQCIKAIDRHGVSNYRLIECLFNSLFRLPTKKYQRSALLSLWGENLLWSVVLHTKGEWKMFIFDDVIMNTMTAHISYHAIYTLHYSH